MQLNTHEKLFMKTKCLEISENLFGEKKNRNVMPVV